MKKDIHPEYRPVVFMDTTTGYKFLSGSTKYSNETVEFEGETYTHSTLDVKSSLKQMDVWIVSTKNTVSNKKPIKTTSTWQWFFLVLPSTKNTAPSGFLKERFSCYS